jgi:hypothetical protein
MANETNQAGSVLPRKRNVRSTQKRIVGTIEINTLLGFIFGVIFLSVMLGFAVGFPNPTPFQLRVFMTALSTAAAGIGAVLPGYIEVRYKNLVRAGGALALFVIVWFFQPVIERHIVTLEAPSQSPDLVVSKFFADLDSGDVAATYRDLDQVSRDTMVPTEALWRQLYDANLKDLGKVETRKLMGVNAFESPSGFPVGIYQQFNYLTKFSNDSGCRPEALIVRATQDKQWRVYSYQISPASIECGPAAKAPAK